MNKYIYHSETNSFYPVSLKDDYMSSGSWPGSGVEISESEFIRFTNPPPGKYRVAGDDGRPELVDNPPESIEQIIANAEFYRKSLIREASEIIAPLSDAKEGGYIDDVDISTLSEWQKYRYALTKVEIKEGYDPVWPKKPV